MKRANSPSVDWSLPAATTPTRRPVGVLQKLYAALIDPRTSSFATKTAERTLNISLLVVGIATTLAAGAVIYGNNTEVVTVVSSIVPALFWLLLFLSRSGYVRDAYIAFFILLLTSGLAGTFVWGALSLITLGIVLTFVFSLSVYQYRAALKQTLARVETAEQERSQLEARIEDRTQSLKDVQIEHVANMQRLVEFGRLASGIFHDLMSPLTAVLLNIDNINTTHETADRVRIIQRSSRRMESLLLSVQKQLKTQHEEHWFSPTREVTDVLDILGHKARATSVTVTIKSDPTLEILNTSLQFYQIILNLLSNAIDACSESEQRSVAIDIAYTPDPSKIRIAVTDTGSGILPSAAEHLFEPFFTTKDAASGTGLGLATTKHIVENELHGSMWATSVPGHGTTFAVSIPLDPSRVRKNQ